VNNDKYLWVNRGGQHCTHVTNWDWMKKKKKYVQFLTIQHLFFLEYLIIYFEIVHGLFLCPFKSFLHTLKFICELQIEWINCPFASYCFEWIECKHSLFMHVLHFLMCCIMVIVIVFNIALQLWTKNYHYCFHASKSLSFFVLYMSTFHYIPKEKHLGFNSPIKSLD
jgi:hypothetical protein